MLIARWCAGISELRERMPKQIALADGSRRGDAWTVFSFYKHHTSQAGCPGNTCNVCN